MALQIWEIMLERNRGSSYRFVLNQLPRLSSEIFVDAASTWGIGGLLGQCYFQYSNHEVRQFHDLFEDCRHKKYMEISSERLPIAYLELLAAMIAVVCFAPKCSGHIVRLNCDSSDAVTWLQKSRCPAGIGFRMLSVIELYKHKYCFKISCHYIRGVSNRSADSLSRGIIPSWLVRDGKKLGVDLTGVIELFHDPSGAWKKEIH